MIVGMGTPHYILPISEASAREIDLIPTWRYASCYPEAIEIMKRSVEGLGAPDIGALVTHGVEGLENAREAFAIARLPLDNKGEMVVKVAVRNSVRN